MRVEVLVNFMEHEHARLTDTLHCTLIYFDNDVLSRFDIFKLFGSKSWDTVVECVYISTIKKSSITIHGH